MNRFQYALAALGAAVLLSGCAAHPAETTAPEIITLPTATHPTEVETIDPNALVEDLSIVLSEGEMYLLNQYPNLKTLDLSGSTCYEAIARYIQQHPDVAVRYTVELGGTAVPHDSTTLTLTPEQFSFQQLLEGLAYLPDLTELTLENVSLTGEQMRQLQKTYPDLPLHYTVEILGNSCTAETSELDLSAMTGDQVEAVEAKLGLLTSLTGVELSSKLSLSDVARLQDTNPSATFRYSFTLFGQKLSTTDTEVVYKNQNIGNDGEELIRQALAVLDNCQRFVLDNCKLDSEVLAGIREDFRDGPKVVWRVYYGVDNRYNALTDQETIRAVYNVTDDTCTPLKYCEGAKYMDLGHNEYLTDLSWAAHMPELEVLIVSGCAVKTLDGFENCKKLTWLELAYCAKLTDIEALVGCESLTYLNLSYTKVSSYAALDGLPLKRFVCLSPKASTDEQNIFVSIHPKPDCISVFYGYSNPYGYGWRYDDNGKTFNEYYKTVVREAFNYDYLEQFLPKDDKK